MRKTDGTLSLSHFLNKIIYGIRDIIMHISPKAITMQTMFLQILILSVLSVLGSFRGQ